METGKTLLALANRHRRSLFLLTTLVVVFSLFPLHTADAFWPLVIGGFLVASLFFDVPVVSDIVGAAAAPLLEALLAFFNIILGVIAGILQGFYIGLGEILHKIIRYFMEIPVSPSSEAIIPFVQDAFDFSRMFVNAFFILILVFIGLATILRLQSYQLQRTLPLLLVVALLVNFSGVLVGFVVDMGNIVANFFLDASLNTAWQTNPWQASSPDAEKVGQNIARILYYTFGVLIYFIVLLLFGVRVIILWTLSILAPFAFAALVLPATRRYWTQWWGQLVQWSIIGVPISFFLYLAGRAISAELPSVEGIDQTVIAVFAPMSALLLLAIGVMLSMQLAPAGAQGVINFGKKAGITAGLAAGSGLWRRVGGRVESGGKRLQGLGKAMETAPEGANLLRRTLARGAKYSGAGLITRWAGRGVEIGSRQIKMRVGDKDTREQKAAAAEVGDRDSFDVFSLVNEELNAPTLKGRPTNWNRITGLLNGVRNRNDGDDIEAALDPNSDAPVKLDRKVLGKAIKAGLRTGPPGYRPLMKSAFGQVMLHPEEYGFDAIVVKDDDGEVIGFEGKDADFLDAQLKSLPSKFNAQDLQGDTMFTKNWDVNTPEGRFAFKTLLKERPDLYSAMIKRSRRAEKSKLLRYTFGTPVEGAKTVEEGMALGKEWILGNAPDVYRYITSPGARSEGLGTDLTPQQANQEIREYQERQRGGPLRTDAELNDEIRERTARLTNVQNQIPRLQNQAAAPNVGTRERQRFLRNIDDLQNEQNRLNQEITGLNEQLDRLPRELNALHEIALQRHAAQSPASPKTQDDIEQEVRSEYERTYRGPIMEQLKQGEAFTRWLAVADTRFGGDVNQAEQERIRQLYERARLRDTAPQLTPRATAKEKGLFEGVARGTNPIPPAQDKQRERKLTGALQNSLDLVQQVEQRINRLSQEVEEKTQRGEDASAQEVERNRNQEQLSKMEKRMNEIRTELNLT